MSSLEAVAGTALDDTTIRTAVAEWLSDSAAAEATYGHISTWETGGVTDMSYLFCGHPTSNSCNSAAASFNEDIGAWDTSGVTRMDGMFREASAFNHDIGGWEVHSVTTMYDMFGYASAFNQDISNWDTSGVTSMRWMFQDALSFDQKLGWCVDDGVDSNYAFFNTPCASTSCGVEERSACPITGYVMTNWIIRSAVTAWLSNPTTADATYGHISTWATGGVTDMSYLLCGHSCSCSHCWCIDCNWRAASFDEDIGAWDTSGVTRMDFMFYGASSFNQDIGAWGTSGVRSMQGMFGRASAFDQDLSGWTVDSVTRMLQMFEQASSFEQDLGWCVDDGVDLRSAFDDTPCASTACGVGIYDTNGVCHGTKETEKNSSSNDDDGAVIAGAAAAVALLLAVGAFWFYRRRKASMTDKADEPSGANPEPTELSPPEEATTPKEEEATIAVAPEGEEGLTEQPPPPPRRWFSRAEPEPQEPAAPKAEEMYNQIAAWYNAPENAALRATWGAYPEPDEFQTWPGFVAVTNAFLDREAG